MKLDVPEGGRGLPHARPPYPAQAGLWGKPTLINNVETFANIAPIVTHGGAWYAGYGTEKSRGTKVFALAGKVNNTGLIEVPLGITVREVIEEIGGGIVDGRRRNGDGTQSCARDAPFQHHPAQDRQGGDR